MILSGGDGIGGGGRVFDRRSSRLNPLSGEISTTAAPATNDHEKIGG